MNKYVYEGPVKMFNQIVADRWQTETMAESERKALSNLAFRYKKSHNLAPNAKITLPGNLTMV